jgi:hypothetical protein
MLARFGQSATVLTINNQHCHCHWLMLLPPACRQAGCYCYCLNHLTNFNMSQQKETLKTFDHLEKKVLEASRLIQNLRDKKINLEDEVKRLKEENGNLKNRQNLIKEKINILLRQIPIDKSRIIK